MFPEKFTERMKNLLGESEYAQFESSFDVGEERLHALRINSLKAGKEAVSFAGEQVPWEERGFYYGADSFPGKHPYHEAGLYYIQEPSAMAPVHFLDPKPGDRVLDLCAAPGGKSTQIADRLCGEGILVTNEINRDRAKILSLNIERMGIPNALVLNEDPGHLSQVFEGYFDKILVDAPCSGEGMFRKNDNAADEWSEDNVKHCAAMQEEILDCAAKMLLPGGRLVYSTCTFSPDENEQNVARFLLKHPDFCAETLEPVGGMEGGRPEWVPEGLFDEPVSIDTDNAGGSLRPRDEILEEVGRSIRLWPHKVSGEGHFLCVFRRAGETDASGQKSYVPGGRNTPAKKEVTALVDEFAGESLKLNPEGSVISFGEQVYLAPQDMPGIKGLKVMRPGLHLGTVKKDRFEPSHALALYLKKNDAVLSVDFASDSLWVQQYLNGQSIRISSEEWPELAGKKGWCLVTCDGYSIGWAKLAGGMLKNHYPKGLRINY